MEESTILPMLAEEPVVQAISSSKIDRNAPEEVLDEQLMVVETSSELPILVQ